MIVAIIPARGGSSRIPRKNIRSFAGKPMICYSIEAAKKTDLFDQIIVSTDDKEIAQISRQAGAEVPFSRPENLSDAYTPTAPVLEHAVNWLNTHSRKVEYFCCIYPTAPFVRPQDIKKGYQLLLDKKASSVFSITTFDFTIFRALRQADGGRLEMFWPENELKRSQDLPTAYHDAGQFYWLNADIFLKNKKVWAPDAYGVLIERYLVQDIDTIEDWQTAELMYEVCRKKGLL